MTKRLKIPLKSLQTPKTEGGAGLVDLKVKEMSIKIGWIGLLQKNEAHANIVYELLAPELRSLIFQCSFISKDVKYIIDGDLTFWINVLEAWAPLSRKYHV